MKRRLFALLLVLFLLTGIVSVPGFATEGETGTQNEGTTGSENPGGGSTENPGGGSTENPGGGSTENPGGSTENPGGSTENPGGSTENPGGSTENPGGSTENPGGSTENPGGSTENPGGSTENPGGSTENPGGTTENPGGSTENPGGSTENPGGTTENPGGTTADPNCEHAWFGGVVTRQPTCIQTGIKTYICAKCGVYGVEELKMTDHTFSYPCDSWCDVCNAYREVEHRMNSAWSKNASGHWHTCKDCGEKQDVADHYPGPAATEEKDQICLTCGYIMTPKKGHVHNYSDKLTGDDTGHWYPCSGCDSRKDFKDHVYDNNCDSECNQCGYTRLAMHTYKDQWGSDENGHWRICSLCNKTDAVEPHTPGSEANENRAQLCTVCGYELSGKLTVDTPVVAPVISDGSWHSDETSHWKQGSNGKQEEALHTWDMGEESWGNVTYVCTVCGAERVEKSAEEGGGFNWGILLLVVLIILFIGAAVALIVVLQMSKKPGRFSGEKTRNRE